MPAKVTRVVVGDRLTVANRINSSFVNELHQELAVMYHLVVATELGILVAEGIEAMGTLGDDLGDSEIIERGDVL